MFPKEAIKKPNTQETSVPANSNNGTQTPGEHLARANKAMSKAWNLIAQRQDKSN